MLCLKFYNPSFGIQANRVLKKNFICIYTLHKMQPKFNASLLLTCRLATVSILWANTSSPLAARCFTASRSPWKSGVKHSTNISGLNSFNVLTVLAKCSEPPSGRSSRSTDVRTMYPTPHDATACQHPRIKSNLHQKPKPKQIEQLQIKVSSNWYRKLCIKFPTVAVLIGSSGSGGGGVRAVLIAQKRHPLVHVSPTQSCSWAQDLQIL